jgi:twitching motility protein PilT
MVNYINESRQNHIVTIEDPIEFLHRNKGCLVNQREVGGDTHGFEKALKSVLRQDPDVVLIGEMRDLETIAAAITISETGHLVFATLHTNSAVQTINRVIGSFEASQQGQIRLQLAAVLKAVVSQRLCASKDGQGMVPACEILINNARVRELIEDPEQTQEIQQSIDEGAPLT